MWWSPQRPTKRWQRIRGGTMTKTQKTPGYTMIERNHTAEQMRTKDIASLTDADVIVFVNNTQLDAADQLRLSKAPACTQRPEHPAPFTNITPISLQSRRRSRSVDAAAITRHPIIHNKHRRATHILHPHLFSQHPLPLGWKFTRALIHDQHAVVAASLSRFSQCCGAERAK